MQSMQECGVDTEVLESLSALLLRLCDKLQEDHEGQTEPLCLQLLSECFRAQRNACVRCPRNQDILQLTLLELVLTELREVEEEDCMIPLRTAQFFALSFQHSCKDFLALSSVSSANDQALAVIRLLDILCEMSGQTKFRALQDHPDLHKATIELLKEVHVLGRANSSVFSVAQDFSLMPSDQANTNPALDFKTHLIRLIGNLCHGHTANQNQLRDKQTTEMQEKEY